MPKDNVARLAIAIRVYPEPASAQQKRSSHYDEWRHPDAMFVIDTETRTDATQRLLFGSYRLFHKGRCLDEGLFHGDDLSDAELAVLRGYASRRPPATDPKAIRELKVLSRRQFLELLFQRAYKDQCLLVGFNLPFDLSRLAFDFADARAPRFTGGFSLGLWTYIDKQGRELRHQFRPRFLIKHLDSKRALKAFGGRNGEESGPGFRGHFLDLRTLAFALMDQGYSLKTACEAFGVENGKTEVSVHGVLTEEYIDYNRQDVQATYELAVKLVEEYDRHPIQLQVTKAYSPASIGKAYLRGMGITPVLERQPDFPKQILGHAQSAFYGGRAGAHNRKWVVPVVHTDFLSMYPTVNALLGLWKFVTAARIRYVEHCASEITAFLQQLRVEDLLVQDTWKRLTAFVKVVPQGDILPTRAKYSAESNDWQIGLNYLYASETRPDQALWFSLPDVVASVILTGRVPKIVDAFRLEPEGLLPRLKAIRLRGKIRVDPAEEDFFRVVVEERKALSANIDLPEEEKARIDKALKVLANATSYGIYAEMNVQESEEKVRVRTYGIDRESNICFVAHPEVPGPYCFPPFASLITGAARLMLALLEHTVTCLGATYAMEDTDSMAIVATETGAVVPCPGGPLRMEDGREAVRTLSWKQVNEVSVRFAALNPYRRDIIPGSILKVDTVNFKFRSQTQRQVYCFAISAKRYAFFLRDEEGSLLSLQEDVNSDANGWKEHGLGHLLNPADPESDDRSWIEQVWLNLIRQAHGLPTHPLAFAHLPAIGRVAVTSPAVMKPLLDFNAGKSYQDQIKPFNFLLTAQVERFGHPSDADPDRFHLIAPFEKDPKKWLRCKWMDQYTGEFYRIAVDGPTGTRTTARVKTYADVLRDYEFHPESKCSDSTGNPCDKQTIGLLQRRHIEMIRPVPIGKESNYLEDVESGMIQDPRSVYIEYPDPRYDEWTFEIQPALEKVPLAWLTKYTSFPRRTLIEWQSGRSRPHAKKEAQLKKILDEYRNRPAEDEVDLSKIAHLIRLFHKRCA